MTKQGVPPAMLGISAIAALYGWAVYISTFRHPGSIGLNYNAPGTDWMVFYGAIRAALAGQLPMIFDGDRFTAYLNTGFADHLSQPLQFRPWVYPPSFLVMLLPFSGMGFWAAYASFQCVTAGCLGAALRMAPDRPRAALPIALACILGPAASVNVVDGQCGFLVAALLVAGFRLLARRPWLGGALLGVLTFKPQFVVLVPVALLALRQWKGLGAASLAALGLVLISIMLFGVESWVWWVRETVQSYVSPDPKWVNAGRIWGNSLWACTVLLGGTHRMASVVQNLAIIAAAGVVYRAFRASLAPDGKLALLLAAALLAAPHWAGYDCVLLVAATGLWLAADTPGIPWRWTLALILWLIPLLGPPVLFMPARFAPLAIMCLIAVVMIRHTGPLTPRPAAD